MPKWELPRKEKLSPYCVLLQLALSYFPWTECNDDNVQKIEGEKNEG